MSKSFVASLFALALGLVFAAGCTRDGASGTPPPPGAPATAGKTGGLKVVYIPKNTGNPYFTEVDKGCQEAAKALGADYTTTAPSKADATSQIPIIEAQIQQKVDVILITPNSPDALNQELDKARQAGITVVTVDADLVKNESHRDACVLPADFKTIGPSQVELLGSLIGYEGNIAILSATTDAPNQNVWIAAMNDTLKQPKYAKMHLVATVYGDDDQVKSTTECNGLLAKFPDLRGIISPTSVGLAASAQVVDRAGVFPGGPHATGKGLQLTGLSTPNQLKKYVGDGSVSAFQLWEPANEGYMAVYFGQQIHEKKVTPTAGAVLETPKFGKTTLADLGVAVGGPLVTFDKSNISKYDF